MKVGYKKSGRLSDTKDKNQMTMYSTHAYRSKLNRKQEESTRGIIYPIICGVKGNSHENPMKIKIYGATP